MGLHVVALDVGRDKLDLALSLGADAVIDAKDADAVAKVIEATHGGAHGVVVTGVMHGAGLRPGNLRSLAAAREL